MNKKELKNQVKYYEKKIMDLTEKYVNTKDELNDLVSKSTKISSALLGISMSNINTILLDDTITLDDNTTKRTLRVITNDGREFTVNLIISENDTSIVYQD